MAVKQLSDGNTDGTSLGQSSTDLVSLYNETPVAQRTNSIMYELTLTFTASNGFGFTTSAMMQNVIDQLEEIRATLTALGIHGGTS